MADHSTCPPLTRQSVHAAHKRIEPYIHRTPVVTCSTLDDLASTPQAQRCPSTGPNTASEPAPHGPTKDNSTIASYTAKPTVRLFFKSENQQKIGAFKARGAFHALGRLIEENGIDSVRARGVVTHSSGNHAQALAFAAKTFAVPAHIVMPTISTPSKIAGTKSHGAEVVFSGSTSEEREKVTQGIIDRTGATLIPPYDHPDIILGAGTQALELEEQAMEILQTPSSTLAGSGEDSSSSQKKKTKTKGLDAVIAPIGGGGMLSGICTALHGTGIRVFGAEPSFEGANDAERGLAQNSRIEKVKTLTIADGLRTPVGEIPWSIIRDREKLAGIYSVSEDQIKAAMRLALERMKVFIEPSAAVGLAVVLYHEGFRRMVEREGGEEGWNVGVILSGGNTTMEAIGKLFATKPDGMVEERAQGTVGRDGGKVVENVPG
ncbi:tryptophan synthase beta subunit-like PLP-dependent enzyme [Hortaea werneckii]|nr:tryptophan synthase beta subunit-like PLP-dependent enzyme [Hortaea werneckii]KAI7302168.1 tryptophan synthase beta subunit-like PLP-dependent enzyme [Hortaea werneckii]